MKILQINTGVNSGSTGRIAEEIGQTLLSENHESIIAYGRGNRPSQSRLIKIGTKSDFYFHIFKSMLFDRQGFGSEGATKKLIRDIKLIQPDIIHLHNLHGYYFNLKVFFEYIKESAVPIVWTLHDSWAYTGHCAFYESINCTKWKTECFDCPKKTRYPSSYFLDQSKRNYNDKKSLYGNLENVHIITPSQWLTNEAKFSILKKHDIGVIHNGINLNVFTKTSSDLRSKFQFGDRKIILGVANIWDERKGLKDFLKLSERIDNHWKIVLIGLNNKQISKLPDGILGISRTESVEDLARWYSLATVFVNPTYQDNFPTTNIEALACGTPVITYKTGGSPEAIDESTGKVLEKGDVAGIWSSIREIALDYEAISKKCRARAEMHFDKKDRFMDYINLYKRILSIE